jgi:hypothetical protein
MKKNTFIHNVLCKILLAFTFISITFCAFSENPNKTYNVKYILDENGYAIPNERTFTVTPTKIYTTRNGESVYWNCEYKGVKVDEPVPGKQVKFHIYYLTNKNVYLIISDYKIVKHNDTFYYRIVFAGQTQLAL